MGTAISERTVKSESKIVLLMNIVKNQSERKCEMCKKERHCREETSIG